jgi:hypothetical protein
MKDEAMSDTDPPADIVPVVIFDASDHGRSALLLVESLLHGLIAGAVLSTREAVEITRTAHEVLCALNEDPSLILPRRYSERPLLDILASLEIDIRGRAE